jgi:hypothetical protein
MRELSKSVGAAIFKRPKWEGTEMATVRRGHSSYSSGSCERVL